MPKFLQLNLKKTIILRSISDADTVISKSISLYLKYCVNVHVFAHPCIIITLVYCHCTAGPIFGFMKALACIYNTQS